MRYFIDTEFIDDGTTIDLISLGIVAEDGRELYLQHSDFIASGASPWVKEHVFPHLSICPNDAKDPERLNSWHVGVGECQLVNCPWRTRQEIADELYTFLDADEYGKPELWGWCAGYDFVALCQIFGTMLDLPAGWPHYIRELQYLLDERGIADSELPQVEGTAHHALADAKQIKAIWEWLQTSEQTMREDIVRQCYDIFDHDETSKIWCKVCYAGSPPTEGNCYDYRTIQHEAGCVIAALQVHFGIEQ